MSDQDAPTFWGFDEGAFRTASPERQEEWENAKEAFDRAVAIHSSEPGYMDYGYSGGSDISSEHLSQCRHALLACEERMRQEQADM